MFFKREFSLLNNQGSRKYLNRFERHIFFHTCQQLPLEKRLFCLMLYYTGARISEIAELRVSQLDFCDKTVVIKTLKKRKANVYRQMQLPDHLLGNLLALIDHRQKHDIELGGRLWSFKTRTASRYIKSVMNTAGIYGAQASAKGLRHGFAVHAVTKAPITKVREWMGHADLETTAIYLQVSGIEDREWAEKLWDEE